MNLNNKVKNRFEISEILKKLLLKVAKLEKNNSTQVNSDWNATSGVAQILNKPTLFSGNYSDLTNKPQIPVVTPQVNPDWNATSGVAEILNKPLYYRTAITPSGTVQPFTSLTIGGAMPVTINEGGLFANSKYTNLTSKPLLVSIEGGLSFGFHTWPGSSTCIISTLINGSIVKIPSVTTKNPSGFINVKVNSTEVLYPGEYLSFTITNYSESDKTLVIDLQNYFNLTAIEV